MSATPVDDIYPEVLNDIRSTLNLPITTGGINARLCGCTENRAPKAVWLCSYHQGMLYGVEVAIERKLLDAAHDLNTVKYAVKQMRDAKQSLAMFSERIDEHVFQELMSPLDDEPTDTNGDLYVVDEEPQVEEEDKDMTEQEEVEDLTDAEQELFDEMFEDPTLFIEKILHKANGEKLSEEDEELVVTASQMGGFKALIQSGIDPEVAWGVINQDDFSVGIKIADGKVSITLNFENENDDDGEGD